MRMEMTPAASRALQTASLWARHEQMTVVLPAHLFWALIEEEEGKPASLLLVHGINLESLLQNRSRPSLESKDEFSLPLSSSCDEVLQIGRELASLLSPDRSVSSEHLLLAVLQQDGSLRSGLIQMGLRFEDLEKEIVGDAHEPVSLDEPLRLEEPKELLDSARILDANANRAREAIRVVEDYCRFALDDAFLSGQLKQMRHRLVEALSVVPSSHLLEARDTIQDVGTRISTGSEWERVSIRDVAQVNLKRLQEALRALEEVGKVYESDLGAKLEQIRYQSYTLERAILQGDDARQRLAHSRIQVLVTGAHCKRSLLWTVEQAIAGGADIIQLREKSLPDRELIQRARELRKCAQDHGALFIVNDRPDIARLVEADGVHLGQDDLSLKDARRIVGPTMLLGVSTHTLEQARQAILEGASYIGVGPTFASTTKHFDEADLTGLELVEAVSAETTIPAFIIGGVSPKTLPQAVAAGARRIAVSHAVCQSDHPRAVVAELLRLLA